MKFKHIFVFVLMGVLLVQSVSAFFVLDHLYWTIKAFDEVDSPITRKCRDRLQLVLDGNTGSDVPVLHYFEGGAYSPYISTHTRVGGYEACMRKAGADIDLQCICIGVGTHNTQDPFSHLDGGMVATGLEKAAAPNLLGHMILEKDYEVKHMKYLRDVKKDPIVTSGTLYQYDRKILNSFFTQSDDCPECDGDFSRVELLNEMSGIDMRTDLNIFRNGYLGTGFYDTVYNQKLQLPWWFWGISVGLMIIGAAIAIAAGIFGKTKWKWVLVAIFGIMFLIGGGIFLAFEKNATWDLIDGALQVPTKLGILDVKDSDIAKYDALALEATKQFLRTGELAFDDASGLTYWDREGNEVTGALNEAEKTFTNILLPVLLVILLGLLAFVFLKAFDIKMPKFRRK